MRALRRPSVVAWWSAAAGILAAHALAYLVTYPGGRQRAAVLHATGHGYFAEATALAAAAGVFALGLAAWRGARGGTSRWRIGSDAIPLALLQVGSFLVLEVAERALAGVHALPEAKLVLVGCALQVLVAWVAAAILRGAAGAGALCARLLGRRRRPRTIRVRRFDPDHDADLPWPVTFSRDTTRGPPKTPRS